MEFLETPVGGEGGCARCCGTVGWAISRVKHPICSGRIGRAGLGACRGTASFDGRAEVSILSKHGDAGARALSKPERVEMDDDDDDKALLITRAGSMMRAHWAFAEGGKIGKSRLHEAERRDGVPPAWLVVAP